MTDVEPIPADLQSATPYLSCADASAALAFYKQAFGAEEIARMTMPGGKIGHAEFKIGAARVMLADEYSAMHLLGPLALGGTPVAIMVYVADVDSFYAHALAHGATELRPPADQFWGDRNCAVTDPYGHRWMFASRKENLTPEEMGERTRAALAAMNDQAA